jgi:hypothetical protein
MNFSKLSRKLRKKIIQISGEVSKGLDKTACRFISESVYGLLASQSVLLTEIGRRLEEPISLKKTEERLSRQLYKPEIWGTLHRNILSHVSSRIKADTLLILDISDINKPYAKKMEYLAQVRDGSSGKIVSGYWLMEVIATELGSKLLLPLYSDSYTQVDPRFKSENDEILKAIFFIRERLNNKGIWVIDRGGDRETLYAPLLRNNCRFIIRLVGNRNLIFNRQTHLAEDLALSCQCPYSERIIRLKDGHEISYCVSYGYRRVKLPGHTQQLYLLVVKGLGEKPLMLLTTEQLKPNRSVLTTFARMYFKRWKIEETIRFVKQGFDLENVRLLRFRSLRNLLALLLLVFWFLNDILDLNQKLKIMTGHILSCSKRVFGIPEFTFYALGDGIRAVFARSPCSIANLIKNTQNSKQLAFF